MLDQVGKESDKSVEVENMVLGDKTTVPDSVPGTGILGQLHGLA